MNTDYIQIGRAPRALRAGRVSRAGWATALLLTGSLGAWAAGGAGATNAVAAEETAPAVERLADGTVASYASIVDQVAPAVVTIRSERMARTVSAPLPDHPFFRDFFGDRLPNGRRQPERREGGMGSGVIVRADGYILTNHHVVDGAETVSVELTDGRTFKAKIVGTDAPSDLAVLKVDGKGLDTLALGDSDHVRVGDVVLAVGNPLGVGQTVTMGIVSAKGRATGAGDGSFEDFIQTDAPINRGNSGGALVSTRGELIGINSQILSPSGGNIGIGFSIPANMARNVMSQLIEHGEVRRGRLGVTIQQITPELAQSLGLADRNGALVSDVEEGSPAAAAGLRRGDVITAFNGAAVQNSNVLRNEVAELQPGTQATLTVVRDGKTQQLNVKLGELAAAGDRAEPAPATDDSRFGLSVEPLTAARARELGVRAARGLIVAAVEPGSRAAEAGLRPGDVIEQVDRKPVTSAGDLRDALAGGTQPALVLVHRGATTIFVTLDRAR